MPEKKAEDRYTLIEVPTEMGLAIQDNEAGVRIPESEVLLKILNTLHEIKKSVG